MSATAFNSSDMISPLIISEKELRAKFEACNREINQINMMIDRENLDFSEESGIVVLLLFLENKLSDLRLKIPEQRYV